MMSQLGNCFTADNASEIASTNEVLDHDNDSYPEGNSLLNQLFKTLIYSGICSAGNSIV